MELEELNIETEELKIEEKFKELSEREAQTIAEESFIFCDFSDSEPVVVKLEETEIFRAYSYQFLLRELYELNKRVANATVGLYLVDDEIQEEEEFLKVNLCPTDTKETEPTTITQDQSTTKES